MSISDYSDKKLGRKLWKNVDKLFNILNDELPWIRSKNIRLYNSILEFSGLSYNSTEIYGVYSSPMALLKLLEASERGIDLPEVYFRLVKKMKKVRKLLDEAVLRALRTKNERDLKIITSDREERDFRRAINHAFH